MILLKSMIRLNNKSDILRPKFKRLTTILRLHFLVIKSLSLYKTKMTITSNQTKTEFKVSTNKVNHLIIVDKENKSEEEPLEFEDLGIIDLDDEEWG